MSDWAAIKTEYICGQMSYAALAEKHGLSCGAVQRRGRNEGWAALRKEYLQNTVAEAVERCSDEHAERISRLVTAAGRAADTIAGAFEDEQQFYRYLVNEPNELGVKETQEKCFRKLDTKAMKEATGILKDLSAMLRDIYDMPTAAVLSERQRKQNEDSGETMVELVFRDGELKDWSE